MPAQFEVSIKVVVRDRPGRVLGLSRHSHKGDLFWDFPGGRLEAGETIADAITREFREELGQEPWSFDLGSPLHVDVWDDPDWDGPAKLIVYHLVEGELDPITLSDEHESHRLFTEEDLVGEERDGIRLEEDFKEVALSALRWQTSFTASSGQQGTSYAVCAQMPPDQGGN